MTWTTGDRRGPGDRLGPPDDGTGEPYGWDDRQRPPRLGLIPALAAEQDRWFLWAPVLFGTGIGLYFALASEPLLVIALGAALIAALLRVIAPTALAAYVATSILLMTSAGFLAAKLRSDRVAAPVIGRQIGPAQVIGWIELVEPRPLRGQRLTVRTASIEGLTAAATPLRVRIRTLAADYTLKPGDAIRIAAVLSPPPGPTLPGGFDFARSAWFQGLGGVGYARAPPTSIELSDPLPWDLQIKSAIERVRQRISARITASLPGETGAIATALITGERGGISDATNDAFRDSGLLHILSISGLHMVIMAGAVFVSVRFLLTLSPALALRYPIKKWAAAAAALGALAYLMISGASFPTVRSYIMISIMFLAVMLDRPAIALRNVALAALLILALYPESLIDVGFQMSFAAVVALVAAYEAIREREQRRDTQERRGPWRNLALFFGGILVSTLIAGLAVAPLAAYHFHKSQQYAMLANLIAIPICNVLVMPAALGALVAMPFALEAWPLRLMGIGIDVMVWCAYRVSALPGAVGRIPEIPPAAFTLMVAGGVWLCLWRQQWRWMGLIAIAAGLMLAPFRDAPDVFVGRDGLVAVRRPDGLLSALAGRNSMFDLARLLEHDGDGRRTANVAEAKGFRCDWSGCTTMIGERRIAVVRHPAALADDCQLADLIVVEAQARRLPGRPHCAGRPLVIDPSDLQRLGAHALRFGKKAPDGAPPGDSFVLRTVAAGRGRRPWTGSEPSGLTSPRNISLSAPPSINRNAEPASPTPGPDSESLPRTLPEDDL